PGPPAPPPMNQAPARQGFGPEVESFPGPPGPRRAWDRGTGSSSRTGRRSGRTAFAALAACEAGKLHLSYDGRTKQHRGRGCFTFGRGEGVTGEGTSKIFGAEVTGGGPGGGAAAFPALLVGSDR